MIAAPKKGSNCQYKILGILIFIIESYNFKAIFEYPLTWPNAYDARLSLHSEGLRQSVNENLESTGSAN